MSLPDGFRARPLDLDDLDEIAAFVEATSIAESGRPHFGRAQMEAYFAAPDFEPTRDGTLVRDPDGDIAGIEWLRSGPPHVAYEATGFVSSEYLGQGIGTALLDWAGAVARGRFDEAPDGARVSLSAGVDAGHRPSVLLMEGYGMTHVRDLLEMRIEFSGPVSEPDLPEGITIRPFEPGADDRAVYMAIDEAFRDHFGYVERSVDDGLARFRHSMTSPVADTSLWWVAEQNGEVAGACICRGSADGDESIGYVGNLSVREPWRGRGLAVAMLRIAFREFQERGKAASTLHVDAENTTGATRLYEKVGMRESLRVNIFEVEMRPGKDIVVR